MERIFGLDIGTTSIGFAVIDHDAAKNAGKIRDMGVRIFPEARDEKDGAPLNQARRHKRLVRRQIRRRRERRRALNQALSTAGLLPAFGTPEWDGAMKIDPYEARDRGLTKALAPHALGRALYHLAKHRHFKGRDLAEGAEAAEGAADEKKATAAREATVKAMRAERLTLGAWLARRDPHERKRGVHATRAVVLEEFKALWAAQAPHHKIMRDPAFKARIQAAIFAQKPVFWRWNTLNECRLMPGEELCPSGAWLSQQRRMLEKVNNLALIGGNERPLDDEERAAILAKLETQASMTFGGVRSALKALYKSRGEPGGEKELKFNLELGGEKKIPGNAVEASLAKIFGKAWMNHPHKQALREAVHRRLWSADYGAIPGGPGNDGTTRPVQRIVILPAETRANRRAEAAKRLAEDYELTLTEELAMAELTLPAGWDAYSTAALEILLPHLKAGIKFGELITGPAWEDWRNETFPDRATPPGGVDLLPSPARRGERERIAGLRNPTVVRARNELRKVVNNLLTAYGKPDLIRVEVARDVGRSKRDREEAFKGMRRQEARRQTAIRDLQAKGIAQPSRDDVEKWLLWKECGEQCPYSGEKISFDALFGNERRFDIEHIWPRSRSFDNGFANKTLCRIDINLEKGNRTPYEAFDGDPARWAEITERLRRRVEAKGEFFMPGHKMQRFLTRSLPEDFTARQMNDTRYAARLAVEHLSELWPAEERARSVKVQAVTGRVTAQLRRLWGLNNILGEDGNKTRADHRHHAVDALTVACAHPGMTNHLSRYWQKADGPGARPPKLSPPWPTVRDDAAEAVEAIVVSHRVRKKVSGPLHEETILGDGKLELDEKGARYRVFIKSMPVERLSLETLKAEDLTQTTRSVTMVVRDGGVRRRLIEHLEASGLPPAKAYPPYPRLGPNGPEIRKARVMVKRQIEPLAKVSTGYAETGLNHHIAIYRAHDGAVSYAVVSLFEAARRLAAREPIVRRTDANGAELVMSLAPGEAVEIPAGDGKGTWIVTGMWANGQIVMVSAIDALGASPTRPNPASLLKQGARKISVDPIGRVRPAND